MWALAIGASGFIGRHLLAALGTGQAIGTYYRHEFPGGVRFDGASDTASALLNALPGKPTHAFVLHGAIDTEACARDPLGTAEINVESVWRVLDGLMTAGVRPVYLSTEYVFDGGRGMWTETDTPVPNTQYGIQKLAVERRLAADPRPSLVVRLSRVVGSEPNTHSVLAPWASEIIAGKRMMCATDQIFSPLSVADAAGALAALARSGVTGLYHLGGPVPYTRMGLLMLLLTHIRAIAPDTATDILPCSLHSLPFTEKRPLDTSISIEKLRAAIDWQFTSMDALCAETAARYFTPGRPWS